MKINGYAEMIPLYSIKPNSSFHYHFHSLPPNTPNQTPPKYISVRGEVAFQKDESSDGFGMVFMFMVEMALCDHSKKKGLVG